MLNVTRSIDFAGFLPVGQIDIGLFFLQVMLLVSSVFLVLLILVQRGKGGGLTGALGGMGGQSAFGSKAGDAFTKITVVTALVWITLCMVTIARYNPPPKAVQKATPGSAMTSGSQEEADAGSSNAGSVGSDESEESAASTENAQSEIQLDLSDSTDAAEEASDVELSEPAKSDESE